MCTQCCVYPAAWASRGAVSSWSQGTAVTPAEALGPAPAWEGGAVFPTTAALGARGQGPQAS